MMNAWMMNRRMGSVGLYVLGVGAPLSRIDWAAAFLGGAVAATVSVSSSPAVAVMVGVNVVSRVRRVEVMLARGVGEAMMTCFYSECSSFYRCVTCLSLINCRSCPPCRAMLSVDAAIQKEERRVLVLTPSYGRTRKGGRGKGNGAKGKESSFLSCSIVQGSVELPFCGCLLEVVRQCFAI